MAETVFVPRDDEDPQIYRDAIRKVRALMPHSTLGANLDSFVLAVMDSVEAELDDGAMPRKGDRAIEQLSPFLLSVPYEVTADDKQPEKWIQFLINAYDSLPDGFQWEWRHRGAVRDSAKILLRTDGGSECLIYEYACWQTARFVNYEFQEATGGPDNEVGDFHDALFHGLAADGWYFITDRKRDNYLDYAKATVTTRYERLFDEPEHEGVVWPWNLQHEKGGFTLAVLGQIHGTIGLRKRDGVSDGYFLQFMQQLFDHAHAKLQVPYEELTQPWFWAFVMGLDRAPTEEFRDIFDYVDYVALCSGQVGTTSAYVYSEHEHSLRELFPHGQMIPFVPA